MSCIQEQPTEGVRPNARENGQIRPSTSVRVTRGAGSGQHLASVLQEGRENANIDAGLGFIGELIKCAGKKTYGRGSGEVAELLEIDGVSVSQHLGFNSRRAGRLPAGPGVARGPVCLITPPSAFLLDERVFVSLGVLKVAASLEAQHYRVNFLDLSGVENFLAPLEDYLTGCQDIADRHHHDDAAVAGGDADRGDDPQASARSQAHSRRAARHAGLFGEEARSKARRRERPRPSLGGAARSRVRRAVQRRRRACDLRGAQGGRAEADRRRRSQGRTVPDRPDVHREPAAGAASGRSEILPLQHRRPPRDQPDCPARLPVRLRLLRRTQQQEPAADPQPLDGVDPGRGRAPAPRARLHRLHVL